MPRSDPTPPLTSRLEFTVNSLQVNKNSPLYSCKKSSSIKIVFHVTGLNKVTCRPSLEGLKKSPFFQQIWSSVPDVLRSYRFFRGIHATRCPEGARHLNTFPGRCPSPGPLPGLVIIGHMDVFMSPDPSPILKGVQASL